VLGRYHQPGPINITLKARICGQDQQWQCTAVLPDQDTLHPELERIWALSRIDEVMEQIREHGESQKLTKQVVEMGTEYSLVTDYTSMVVLNPTELENQGIQTRNAQRVQRERQAQQQRNQQPVNSYRVDNRNQKTDSNQKTNNQGMFKGRRSPGFGGGTGPVGPVLLGLLIWARKQRKRE
jgi:Ca-activated chloride channel family protein